MGKMNRVVTVLVGTIGTAALVLTGCSSGGSDGASSSAAVATTVEADEVETPGLDKAAQAVLNDPDAAWDSMTDQCRTEVSSLLGTKDGFVSFLEKAIPFTIVSADEASGEVIVLDAADTERTEIFVRDGDAWKLTCDGDILDSAVADTGPMETAPAQPAAAQPEQVTFTCGEASLYERGTAIYSDGTTGFEAACGPGITNPYGTQGRDGAAVSPGQEYSEYGQPVQRIDGIAGIDTNGDGVLSGFERCGVACGDAPTSGQIQTKAGCEEGWIDDPELCARVNY